MNPERISLVNPEVVVTHAPSSSSGVLGGSGGARAKMFVAAVLGVTATVALTLVALGASGGGAMARGVWSGGVALGSRGKGAGFPTVRVFVNPHEKEAFDAVKKNWEHYHKGGSSAVTPLALPDLQKWPKDGGYREITGLIGDAQLQEGTEFEYLQFDMKHKRPQAISDNHEEFASFSLGHLTAWLEGMKKRVPALIVSDYRNLITNHMGPPEDFDAFVMSFLLKGPEKWDVLFLDKGERGVREANLKSPYMKFKNPSWTAPYVVYKNHMDSTAGASFYMVSDKFLKQVPALLKDFRFTMVDGWLSVLCRDGQLKCFSYMQEDWFYGLKTEHLEGHHPPDVRDIPTSDILLANGGKPTNKVEAEGGGGGLKGKRAIFSSDPSTLGKKESDSDSKSPSSKSSSSSSSKKSRKVGDVGSSSSSSSKLSSSSAKHEHASAAALGTVAIKMEDADAAARDAMEMMDKDAEEVGEKVEMSAEEMVAAAAQHDETLKGGEEAAEATPVEGASVEAIGEALQQERDVAEKDAAAAAQEASSAGA